MFVLTENAVKKMIKWHKLEVGCPRCHKSAAITKLYFAADGDVLIESLCIGCKVHLNNVTSFQKEVARCHSLDLETFIPMTISTGIIQ